MCTVSTAVAACIYALQATEFLLEKLQENIKEIPEKFNLQSRKTKEIKKYWERVVHTIKALGNSGVSKTIKAVRDVLEKKMLQTEARTAAVYALKRVARKHPLEVWSFSNMLITTLIWYFIRFLILS